MGTTYSAPDIYTRIKSGNGSGPMAHNSAVTAEQANVQSQLNDQINELTNKMNAAWQGNAADQAVSGAAPLATSAETASYSLTSASQAMSNQVSAFTSAYNSVVPMPTSPPANNVVNQFVTALGVNTPLDQQINNYNSDGQHNVQVYNSYSTESVANAAQMPTTFDTLPTPHPTVSVIGGTSTATGTYGTFTSPSGSGGYSSSQYGGGTATSGAPTWTEPGGTAGTGTRGVVTSGGPGAIWEPGGGGAMTTTPSDFGSGGTTPSGEFGFPNADVPFGGPGGYVGGPGGEDQYYPAGGPGYIPGAGGNPEEDQEYPVGYHGPGSLTDPNGGFYPGGPGPANGPGGFAGPGSGGPGGSSFRPGISQFGTSAGAGGPSGPGATSSANANGGNTVNSSGDEVLLSRGGLIGMPMSGAPGEAGMIPPGRGAKGEEDKEHKTAEYLQEADPDALFGSDQLTVPPVLGE